MPSGAGCSLRPAVLRPQGNFWLSPIKCSACPFQNLPRWPSPAGAWLVTVSPSGWDMCVKFTQFTKVRQNPDLLQTASVYEAPLCAACDLTTIFTDITSESLSWRRKARPGRATHSGVTAAREGFEVGLFCLHRSVGSQPPSPPAPPRAQQCFQRKQRTGLRGQGWVPPPFSQGQE